MLRVHVLGDLVVESAGRPVELTGSWRARSLFAWLAVNPGAHARADVAARFWPEVLDTSARASLRNALWAVRRALGPEGDAALVATRERVGLEGPPLVWVDAAEFEEHFAAGRLDDALALCRGELLAGIDDDWVHEHRDAHRLRVSELLEAMAARAEATDLTAAVALSRKRVALDPLAEDSQRALIARLSRSGDRGGALVAYSRLRDRLRRDLGVSPSPETRGLADRIRTETGGVSRPQPEPAPRPRNRMGGSTTGDWEPGRPFPLPPRLRQPTRTEFVGREAELAALRDVWRQVTGGGGARLALVTGEAGMGKTRLAQELAIAAQGDGAIVLHGSASEDLLMPLHHFVDAIGHLLAAAAPAELRRRVDPRAADLAPVAPGLAVPAPDPAPGDAPQESRRYRLFEAVASLVDDLAADAPVLLLIDDLHWADQSTASLLRHLLESRPATRLLVVATQRPGEGARAEGQAEALQRLAQGEYVERVALPGLSDEEVTRMADTVGSRDLSPEVARAIREETGGNPFFVQEIVRHAAESQQAASVVSLARADVPDRVREVVNLRLGRLGDACVRLLTVGAVVGVEFDLDTLERVSDLEGEDLAAALDEALAADLVVEADSSEHELFAFSHALVRRTLLGRLTRAHRRRIHARVAETLEAVRGDAALLEIAHHLCEARPVSDRETALAYAVRAAEHATTGLAYAEAVDLFTRARSLLPPDDPRRRTLALKRALAYQALFHAVMDTPSGQARTDVLAAAPDG